MRHATKVSLDTAGWGANALIRRRCTKGANLGSKLLMINTPAYEPWSRGVIPVPLRARVKRLILYGSAVRELGVMVTAMLVAPEPTPAV